MSHYHLPIAIDTGRLHAALATLGGHHGKLDGALSLTTSGGPVGLGFLDLALELYASRALVRPARGAFQVTWDFTDTRLAMLVTGDVAHDGPTHTHLVLRTSLEARNVTPGLVGMADVLLAEPGQIVRRKGGDAWRPVHVGLRLRRVPIARPIGTIPGDHHGTFLPFQA